ncbi:hypothetical protein BH11PSE6_BH11PSE6_15660 [soil metagenome]
MDRLTLLPRNLLLAAALLFPAVAQAAPNELAGWKAQATRVTITRDDWGIAHVVGKSDADAVFGAIYAQAEDDFSRIEANYLTALGRTAEAEGEKAIWADCASASMSIRSCCRNTIARARPGCAR